MIEGAFNEGKPPHIGWWYTYCPDVGYFWRWWFGDAWSWGFHKGTEIPMDVRPMPPEARSAVFWNDHYPENARVARVDPDALQVIDNVEHYPAMKGFEVSCCKCGSKHVVDFTVYRGIPLGVNKVKLRSMNQANLQIGIKARKL